MCGQRYFQLKGASRLSVALGSNGGTETYLKTNTTNTKVRMFHVKHSDFLTFNIKTKLRYFIRNIGVNFTSVSFDF